jgi:hypothetical protein
MRLLEGCPNPEATLAGPTFWGDGRRITDSQSATFGSPNLAVTRAQGAVIDTKDPSFDYSAGTP